MTAVVVIPARYGSTRFPAKIVASRTGKPLVQHVVEQAKKCPLVRETIVATDDQRIIDALRSFETQCVMTSAAHQSGTDRIAEVAKGLKDEIIVNVQGDEPEIEPAIIDSLVERLQKHDEPMATAATPFPAGANVNDPNLVKVVTDWRQPGDLFLAKRDSAPSRQDHTASRDLLFASGNLRIPARFPARVCKLETDAAGTDRKTRAAPCAGAWRFDLRFAGAARDARHRYGRAVRSVCEKIQRSECRLLNVDC